VNKANNINSYNIADKHYSSVYNIIDKYGKQMC